MEDTNVKVGIIGAMDEEIEFLSHHITEQSEETVANCLFIEGKLHGKRVVLLKSGIGKVNAAMATSVLHERYKPTIVINTGSAGGYSDKLNVGDVVVSEHVVHHDVDATGFNYAYGQVPGMPLRYTADQQLIERTVQAINDLNIPFATGTIGTGDSFMNDDERISFIRKQFESLIAVEMEAAAVAQVCYQYNTPFVVIRALSDIAGKESTVSFDEFLKLAAKHASDIVMQTIKTL